MTQDQNHSRDGRRLTIYRDDSTVQVVYDRVKAVFWTAGNTVLVVSQYTGEGPGHRYIHWPRERVCWFKDELSIAEGTPHAHGYRGDEVIA